MNQMLLPFEDPQPKPEVIVRHCWMEECGCMNRSRSLEHEMWFHIRWYIKHLLVHRSDAKYLAQVREWVRTSEPKGLFNSDSWGAA